MTGSLMVASQPVAKVGVTDHQAETAEAEEKIDKVEHGRCSAAIDRRAEHETKDIKSRLGNRGARIKKA